ncbi:hypothetical protein SCLARK_00289 [Spiroplasma clarkii]|uniref:MATE efflux family protein n=1 Tax=Spiroplasma clarkii TaxID=2139 RepID=A0A1Y0KZ76_9MOLU|nr:MATE family efflux transporter [Spiroplasma clarkii]ARU91046.1 hypothetical protein SCLARK_00289 [Spiroplasma clarkii]ATX70482.1 hypothetical protein SCLAR_v1c01510 [Spiroplasma clarkii]
MKKSLVSDEQLELVKDNLELNFLLPNKLYKNIWVLTLPIYLQLISTVVLSMVNNLLIRWVDGGVWTSVINKANFAYSWFNFIPTFSSAGIFVVIGNLIGKGKKDEIYQSVFQGFVFNLALCCLVILGLIFCKKYIYEWANLPQEYWKTADILYYTNLGALLLVSVHIVMQRVEAASGNLKHLFLVILVSGIINTVIVCGTMFLINPVLSVALGVIISNLFTVIAMFFLNRKHVNYKKMLTDFKKCWDSEILKTILIVIIPSVVETLVFNLAAAVSTKFITDASLLYEDADILFVTLISIQQITNFGLLMSSALGQVSLIYVSRLNGSKLTELCVPVSLKIWYLTLVVAMPFSLITVALTYPLLKIYNIPTEVIWNTGIFMFIIIAVQDIGRSMNQVGLSSLRAVKYTVVPVIVSIVTLLVFNIGFIYLTYSLMQIQKWLGEQNATNQVQVKNIARNYLLIVCGIQAVEEIVRGGLYMILWTKKAWIKKPRKEETNNEKDQALCSSPCSLR